MVTRKKKPNQVENIDNAEDKISRLPDDLIHRILSFVPTKCAICTSILSKRWKRVSNSISILDFRNWRTLDEDSTRKELKQETKQFMNYLDTVLYHHVKPYIQKFYLHLDGSFDESRVIKWISTIINRKVEEFYLSDSGPPYIFPGEYSTSFLFPRSFFTCDSFTQLELHFSEEDPGIVNIPNTVSFPNLKKLKLRWVSFVNEVSNRKFFSNCPILEELRLINCDMSEGLYIVNPALKHLFITYCFLEESTMEISAPSLLTISYRGDAPEDFVLSSTPSLVEANVDFDFIVGLGDPKVVVKLFEILSSVKHLKISAHLFEVLRGEVDILSAGSLTFYNLIQLEICTESPYDSALDSISKVRTLFKFLQLSPNLGSILFDQNIGLPDEEADGLSLDPKYSLPHLKSIKVMDFNGEPAELNVIKLFLKYAGFLETVTIVASPGLSKDQKKQLDVTKLLLKFPKPANCVIDVLEEA